MAFGARRVYDRPGTMALIFTFLLGVANFALHKAALESGHPLLARIPWLLRMKGGRFSLLVEFLILLAALVMVANGSIPWAWGYALYSLFNGLSAWLILSGRA